MLISTNSVLCISGNLSLIIFQRHVVASRSLNPIGIQWTPLCVVNWRYHPFFNSKSIKMKDKIKNIAEKLEHQIRMHELDLNDRITNQRDGSFGLLVCFCCNKQVMCQRIWNMSEAFTYMITHIHSDLAHFLHIRCVVYVCFSIR